ncbi:hypothetical protein E8E14_014836 [Neopestalotiopsis sp. 37M]|nr:hypothetical protein E8E14_014836 [Neopestalotiopsis sp. 37M]
MALAYPEGECFFRRSALNSSNKAWYQADRPDHFYGNFLLEFIWNKPSHTGDEALKSRNHPRTSYKLIDKSIRHWRFPRRGPFIGAWKQLPIVYGSHYSKGKHRRVQHNLCTYDERLEKQMNGDAMESWFMTMPMPKREEGWAFIDRVTNIRAIYIPIAQQASEDHPELCTFYQVNFAVANNKVKILHHSGSARKPTVTWRDVSLNKTLGLPDWWSLTVGINFNGLVELLSLPRQLRAQNAFSSGNVIMIDKDLVASPRIEHSYSDDADFDWAKVASANYGLAIQWKPSIKKQDWMENFLKNSLTVAVGFIPGIGPIAAIAFPLAWTAIADPDNFVDTLRNVCPGVDLQLKVVELLSSIGDSSSKNVQKYLPEGWEQSALGPKFLSGPRTATTMRMAALTSEPETDPRPESLVSEAETSIIDELKALNGQDLEAALAALVSDDRAAEDIAIFTADTTKSAVVTTDDIRLEDEIDNEQLADTVTLDEVGPSMYFTMAEQVLKDTAVPQEESEWAELVKAAESLVDTVTSPVTNTLDSLGSVLGGGKQEETEVVEDDPTVSDAPVNDFSWSEKYLRSLFAGEIAIEGKT